LTYCLADWGSVVSGMREIFQEKVTSGTRRHRAWGFGDTFEYDFEDFNIALEGLGISSRLKNKGC
jgi:hypothetical protein